MNKAHLRWRLGRIDSQQLHDVVLQNELDKLREAKAVVYSYRKSSITVGVTSVALDPSGHFLLASGEDGSVGLWALDEVYNNEKVVDKRIQFARGESKDSTTETHTRNSGTHIVARRPVNVSGNYRGSSKFFASVESSESSVPSSPHEMYHAFSISTVQWYGSDNGLFFTGSNDRKVKIWDTNTFQVASSLDMAHRVSQLDTNGDLIAVATEDSHPRLIDLRSMSATISLGTKHTDMRYGINSAKFSREENSNAKLLATGDNDGNVRIWDLRKGNSALCDLTEPDTMSKAHARCCNDICWNPSGGHELVTTGNDGKYKMWALNRGDQCRVVRQLGATDLMANRFRRRTAHYLMWEGPYVFCNSDHGEVVVYEANTGRQWHAFQYPLGVGRNRLTTPRFQSIALQTGLANSIGVRLILGTDHTHGKILEYRV
ncbi:LAME_0H13476g1_1 [Lachancea meyersii CBS 8951]|uniref:LAME_0H13476g1_1 n=1 Tax=Lachancea meyersii CBS 8951 TaxID=1266667 RepID=A0A1G4KH76_9SACH|nr:LAME_0H13476g1_1 [Lachancea meyersii CBS 8951]